MDEELLEGQLAYYRARAGEYDEWFLRKGRHDRGPEWNRRWFWEIEEVRRELDRFRPTGNVLELACGTGLWTVELARHAASVTAVDASPEVLEINRTRLREVGRETRVRYVGQTSSTGAPTTSTTRSSSASGSRTCRQGGSPPSGSSSAPRCGLVGALSSWTL